MVGFVAGRVIDTHLFVLCPNNSGSTFLTQALAQCRGTWSMVRDKTWTMVREGHSQPGFHGPHIRTLRRGHIWAGSEEWADEYRSATSFDWKANKSLWYRNARPRSWKATVFVEKSPPFLLIADQLRDNFENARFCIMVRHPLPVVEGILRAHASESSPDGRDMRVVAAQHVGRCLEYQARNIELLGDRAVVFTYETLCSDPKVVANQVKGLCPKLDDLDFDVRLRVKRRYDEQLRNMNSEQVARLDPQTLRIAEVELAPYTDAMARFGYTLSDVSGGS